MAATSTTERHPSADYLEALYEIREENLPPVQAELARWMGVSRTSVSDHVRRLIADGLISTAGRELGFTPAGEAMAVVLVRRHRLAEHLLVGVIGLPWHLAHAEAERWERVISDAVEERLVALLDDPGACPHGNPIPGSANLVDYRDLRPLAEVGPPADVTLRRLTEDLELEIDVMRFLEDSGLMPGATFRVQGIAPDGAMSLAVDGRPVALGAHLADNLWVEPRS
ncbi:MAG TPA: metal-dependent transcriptional regulator [Actinomycetota bacterium]